MKKHAVYTIVILIILVGLYYRNSQSKIMEIDLPTAQQYQKVSNELVEKESIDDKVDSAEFEPVIISKLNNINLAVPFTSQAPTANWAQPYQDACEEASLLMVDYYYQNKKLPNAVGVESVLTGMVDWQKEEWGGHFNLPITQVAEYAKMFYDYKVEIVTNLTTAKIEAFLNQGIPVIVPADGHKLDNPNFSGNGPDYHMLVIKGYVDNNFITNDPGTRNGANFIYSYDNLMYSIADWDIKKSSAAGPKNALILYKN